MLKLQKISHSDTYATQPPSGGCVLKHEQDTEQNSQTAPAAFRRLCVETIIYAVLCARCRQPPSGGCVLKQMSKVGAAECRASRLQAAVC